jgi:hypothetical protein
MVDTPVGKHHIGDIHIDADKYIPGPSKLADSKTLFNSDDF